MTSIRGCFVTDGGAHFRRAGLRAALAAVCGVVAGGCSESTAPANGGNARLIDTSLVVPAPPLLTEMSVTANYGVHDTFIRDGIAFVCQWRTGLVIYDVGNGMKGGSPANPQEISRIITGDAGLQGGAAVHNAWWFHNPVSVEQRYVFVGQEGPANVGQSSSGDIHVVDISDITQPVEVAFYHMDASPTAGTHNFWMDEQAQILYAAYYNGGVIALDVSGPLSGDLASREIARIKPAANSFVWGVQLSGGSLYATDMANGFYQLRLADNALTVVGGGANVLDRFSSDLWVIGNHAYTGTWGLRSGSFGNAINIWRLDAGGAPALADSVVIAGIGTVSDVKGTDDGKLLIASAENGPWGGLYIFSLTNPLRPELVGRARVAAGGLHTAKVADISGRLYVFAARNPSSAHGPSLMIYDITSFLQ